MGISLVAEAAAVRAGVALAQDQVHILRHEAVNDGGAVGDLAAGVLILDLHLVAQGLFQRVGKALGGGVQRGMGSQLQMPTT